MNRISHKITSCLIIQAMASFTGLSYFGQLLFKGQLWVIQNERVLVTEVNKNSFNLTFRKKTFFLFHSLSFLFLQQKEDLLQQQQQRKKLGICFKRQLSFSRMKMDRLRWLSALLLFMCQPLRLLGGVSGKKKNDDRSCFESVS